MLDRHWFRQIFKKNPIASIFYALFESTLHDLNRTLCQRHAIFWVLTTMRLNGFKRKKQKLLWSSAYLYWHVIHIFYSWPLPGYIIHQAVSRQCMVGPNLFGTYYHILDAIFLLSLKKRGPWCYLEFSFILQYFAYFYYI